jgi:hypothetical protein
VGGRWSVEAAGRHGVVATGQSCGLVRSNGGVTERGSNWPCGWTGCRAVGKEVLSLSVLSAVRGSLDWAVAGSCLVVDPAPVSVPVSVSPVSSRRSFIAARADSTSCFSNKGTCKFNGSLPKLAASSMRSMSLMDTSGFFIRESSSLWCNRSIIMDTLTSVLARQRGDDEECVCVCVMCLLRLCTAGRFRNFGNPSGGERSNPFYSVYHTRIDSGMVYHTTVYSIVPYWSQ